MTKKKTMEAITFLVILIIAFFFVYKALCFKYGDGILGLKYLYEQQEDSVDVLVLGSSHAFEDISTQVLFDEYGIASYVLAGSVQPMWNTYYYLQEALKTQTPKLIILEGYTATQSFNYSDHSRIIKNNLGIKDLKDRYESILVSAPADTKDDYIFEYRLWHSRYEELNSSDFADYYEKPIFKYYKGFGINTATTPLETPDVNSFRGEMPVNEKEEEYFRKIIGLCQGAGIPIAVVISPYRLNEVEQQKFNYLGTIAEECQVPYINFNSSEYYTAMELNFSSDFADTAHLNHIGSIKYTKVLGRIIKDMVSFDDRREDEEYVSWVMHSKDIRQRISNYSIAAAQTVNELITNINAAENLSIFLYTISNCNDIESSTNVLTQLGAPQDKIGDGKLFFSENGELQVYADEQVQWSYNTDLGEHPLDITHIITVEKGILSAQREIVYNNKQYIDDLHGIYILVYDNFTQDLVTVKQVRMTSDKNVEVVTK